jgi:hypothetical protein
MSEQARAAREYELPPHRAAWANMIGDRLGRATTDAEWIWYGRIAYLPEHRWQRAIDTTWMRSIAAKAGGGGD